MVSVLLVFVVVLLEVLLLIVVCGENNKCGRSSGAIVGFGGCNDCSGCSFWFCSVAIWTTF